jgi:hypothetical protein
MGLSKRTGQFLSKFFPDYFWDYAQNGSEAAQDVEVLRLVN